MHHLAKLSFLRFYENGHEVIGVEIAEEPVKELYQGSAIAHSVQEIENVGSIYKVSFLVN